MGADVSPGRVEAQRGINTRGEGVDVGGGVIDTRRRGKGGDGKKHATVVVCSHFYSHPHTRPCPHPYPLSGGSEPVHRMVDV